jgi:hypothetical protein
MNTYYDICVVGGGSGGFGAACAAARLGAKVILIEAGHGLGGTSTYAGVNNYEPVAGATGLPQELYEHLLPTPNAVAIQQPIKRYTPEQPWGKYTCATETDYRLSLSRKTGTAITFEPELMDKAMQHFLQKVGCTVHLQTRFTDLQRDGNKITSITVQNAEGTHTIQATVFIDATADIYLARAAGCQSAIGTETPDAYDEPSAPEQSEIILNNASLCYRIAPLKPGEEPDIPPIPTDVDLDKLRPVTSIRTYPNGDLNMNPLHTMTGLEAFELGDQAYAVAHKRMQAHWHILQTQYGFEFAPWKMTWTSPFLGVRETHRLVGQYVLREQDLMATLANQDHNDIVAIADHAIDFHGARPSSALPGPYGIPFRCLLPKDIPNLLVACRGASFSSIGASSCRLSRTMMVLGQAAGTASALFGKDVHNFNASQLRAQLKKDGVALDLETGYLDAMPHIEPIPDCP